MKRESESQIKYHRVKDTNINTTRWEEGKRKRKRAVGL
jgi:hypothetical protein